MKFLHVLADSDPSKGGVIEGVRRLGDALRALGHEQHLLTLDAIDDPWVTASAGPVFAVGKPGANKRFYPYKAIAWLKANARDYDGVIVDGLWNSATLAATRVLPGMSVPYAVFPHGMLDPWFREMQPLKEWAKRQLFRVNERRLLRDARAVLFTSEQERRLAAAAWPGWHGIHEQVIGFGTGIPPSHSDPMTREFAARVPQLNGQPYVLFLSRIHPKKGCELLLQGFAEMDGDWHLVMAGPADPTYLARLQQLASERGISQCVHWPGMLEGDVKWGGLYGCEAVALTSYQENFGVVVAEAMACGRPVLISDQVNIHASIVEAEAGLICQTNTPSVTGILREFRALATSERLAMGLRGRDLFHRTYTMDHVAEQIVELFK